MVTEQRLLEFYAWQAEQQAPPTTDYNSWRRQADAAGFDDVDIMDPGVFRAWCLARGYEEITLANGAIVRVRPPNDEELASVEGMERHATMRRAILNQANSLSMVLPMTSAVPRAGRQEKSEQKRGAPPWVHDGN